MPTLTHRERVLATLNHTEPDRVPKDLGGRVSSMMVGAYRELKRYLGIDDCPDETINPDHFAVEEYDERVLQHFDIDFRRVFLQAGSEYRKVVQPDGTWLDEMGFLRRFSGMYGEQVGHELRKAETPSDIRNYRFFDAYDPARTRGLQERVQYLFNQTDYAIVAAGAVGGVFETATWMRGFDQFPVDLMLDKPLAHALLRKLNDYYLELMDAFLSVVGPYVHIVELADDPGSQQSLLLSPELYREMIMPYHLELIDFVKSKTDARIFFHSCGSVVKIVDLLLEAGVDILNPLQPRATGMDSTFLKDSYGDRLSFHGGVDIQEVLPNGTPMEVEAEVMRRLAIYGPGGGYILCASHCLQDDVPPRNIEAMYDAADSWGSYPLNGKLVAMRPAIPTR